MLCSNMHSIAATALAARRRHRLARAFVRALRAPVEGVLSADGPGDLPFVVEWTGPERLRVRSDGSGPLPPDPAGPRKPFVWGNGFVEADLPPSAR
jgi:hypothetical protein